MMLSSEKCDDGGHARVPSVLLSLDTVCQQLIEDIDQSGWSGYLTDLLPLFEDETFVKGYGNGGALLENPRIRHNRSNPGFLVPPEDQEQTRAWLEQLDERMHGQ
jgi:hypothetical protein